MTEATVEPSERRPSLHGRSGRRRSEGICEFVPDDISGRQYFWPLISKQPPDKDFSQLLERNSAAAAAVLRRFCHRSIQSLPVIEKVDLLGKLQSIVNFVMKGRSTSGQSGSILLRRHGFMDVVEPMIIDEENYSHLRQEEHQIPDSSRRPLTLSLVSILDLRPQTVEIDTSSGSAKHCYVSIYTRHGSFMHGCFATGVCCLRSNEVLAGSAFILEDFMGPSRRDVSIRTADRHRRTGLSTVERHGSADLRTNRMQPRCSRTVVAMHTNVGKTRWSLGTQLTHCSQTISRFAQPNVSGGARRFDHIPAVLALLHSLRRLSAGRGALLLVPSPGDPVRYRESSEVHRVVPECCSG